MRLRFAVGATMVALVVGVSCGSDGADTAGPAGADDAAPAEDDTSAESVVAPDETIVFDTDEVARLVGSSDPQVNVASRVSCDNGAITYPNALARVGADDAWIDVYADSDVAREALDGIFAQATSPGADGELMQCVAGEFSWGHDSVLSAEIVDGQVEIVSDEDLVPGVVEAVTAYVASLCGNTIVISFDGGSPDPNVDPWSYLPGARETTATIRGQLGCGAD